ncbi:hypothetical protein DFH09DRAFT_1248491 [Mycena vulgaris]|nr:hypothetical protein DFH09DRAFT_1248491 [Mycena vulgaris]
MASSSSPPWTKSPGGRRRQIAYAAFGAVALLLLLGAAHPTTRRMGHEYYELSLGNEGEKLKTPGPPSWDALRKWEAELPQHDLELPFPEGRTGRYVKFSNQVQMLGWNNCLNEELMNLHLAYTAQRAYVFTPYRWAPQHYPWPAPQHPPGGPLTPLPALLAGPLSGGPWPPGDPAPRSVSASHFDLVCPPASRRILHTDDIKPAVADAPGDAVLAHWVKILKDAPEACVEVIPGPGGGDSYTQTFDLGLWGSTRILPLWPLFAQSPVSLTLAPSPIVASALARNAYLFAPRGPRPPPPPADGSYPRMLAVHVRRGDYVEHCKGLAAWGSSYYSWAQLPELPDHFTPGGEGGEEAALRHCLPSAAQLAERIRAVRDDWVKGANGTGERVLDTLYLLTNEDPASPWMRELKTELGKGDKWSTLATSRELVLDAEQTEVGMAVDMEIARRAAVFLGNGWSSFTSNIVHARLVDGREARSIRFT